MFEMTAFVIDLLLVGGIFGAVPCLVGAFSGMALRDYLMARITGQMGLLCIASVLAVGPVVLLIVAVEEMGNGGSDNWLLVAAVDLIASPGFMAAAVVLLLAWWRALPAK